MTVRLTQLQATEDAQTRISVTALLDLLQVASGVEARRVQLTVPGETGKVVVGVERVHRHPPHGVVNVLGEGDRWKPYLDGPLARRPHRTVGGVP